MPFDTWQFGKNGILVNLITKKWKSKHLLCLSVWDMSCDPEFRILISVQKMRALSAADLVHGDFCRTKKNAQAKDLVYIEQIVGIMIWMWLQKCLGIIVQVCKYILENCQKFYSSPPAIKCVKYLLPVLIFKSKTASQGGLSFFLSTQ